MKGSGVERCVRGQSSQSVHRLRMYDQIPDGLCEGTSAWENTINRM